MARARARLMGYEDESAAQVSAESGKRARGGLKGVQGQERYCLPDHETRDGHLDIAIAGLPLWLGV